MGEPIPDPTPEELQRLRLGLRVLALRKLGDPAAADEVAQETLVRVVEALRRGRLRCPDRLGSFARGVLRHVVADRFRGGRRRVALGAVGIDGTVAVQDDTLALLVSTEERQRVRAALARLSERDREVLRLCYYDGLTPSEAASHLGEPAPRIRKRKSRALDRLRDAFGDTPPGHGLGASTTCRGRAAERRNGSGEGRWPTGSRDARRPTPGIWRNAT